MKAAVGDRMVVTATRLDGPVRDGEILRVGDAEGGAPYLVRWSDSGRESLFFPGPDAHVYHQVEEGSAGAAGTPSDVPGGEHTEHAHTKEWHVDIYLYESGDATSATAVLHSEVPTSLQSHGEARRRPEDHDVPEIGDEVAVARALRRLADRLLASASDDLAAVEGHPVDLTP